MKGIPYRTHWIAFPLIREYCISIGAAPTLHIAGEPIYTLPVIHDPNTGATISESFEIVKYLHETYPSPTPSSTDANIDKIEFIPAGTTALQQAFTSAFTSTVISHLTTLIIADIGAPIPGAQDYEFWKRSREVRLGVSIDEFVPKTEERRRELWGKAIEGFRVVGGWLDANGDGDGGRWVMGQTLSWADVLIANWVLSLRRLWGEDDGRWRELMELSGGRWKKYFESVLKYEWVDEEGLKSLGGAIEERERVGGKRLPTNR